MVANASQTFHGSWVQSSNVALHFTFSVYDCTSSRVAICLWPWGFVLPAAPSPVQHQILMKIWLHY